MHLDTLIPGQQVDIQEGILSDSTGLIQWTPIYRTTINITSSQSFKALDTVTNIHLSFANTTFKASDWKHVLNILVNQSNNCVKIVGVDGPWREIKHPDFPHSSKHKVASPIRQTGPINFQL